MRVGIGLLTTTPGGEGRLLIDYARRAEAAGFSSLGVVDRVVYGSHDPLPTLAAATTVTDEIRLVTMIVIGPIRETGLLAKQAATIDGCRTAGSCSACRSARKARTAWIDAGRPGEPLLWCQSYFALGDADAGEAHMRDYYPFTGSFAEKIVASLLTTPEALRARPRHPGHRRPLRRPPRRGVGGGAGAGEGSDRSGARRAHHPRRAPRGDPSPAARSRPTPARR